MMEEKKKKGLALEMEKVGLNPKKEMTLLILIDAILLIIAYWVYSKTHSIIAPISIALFMVAGDIMLLGRAKKIGEIDKETLEIEFVHIFSYFKIFITNGRPVYNALEDCIRYSSPKMERLITSLLIEIDKDKSVKPYLRFAESFKSLEIRQVMISIYKMSVQGATPLYFEQFDTIFGSLSAEKRKQEIDKSKTRLESLNFLPLADSALTMGLIVVAIVTIMGRIGSGI